MPALRRLSHLAAVALAAGCQSPTDGGHQPQELRALPRPLTVAEQEALAGSTEFGLALFRTVNASHRGENVVLSPLSATLALGMALNGASGATLDSMRRTLGWGTRPMPEVNDAYRGLLALLTTLDPAVQFVGSNSIWVRQEFPVLSAFSSVNQQTFAATTRMLDFDSPSAASTINAWVSQSTNGRIPTIVDSVEGSDVLFLINAIWFKGQWRDQFRASLTRPAPFANATGDTTLVPMMHRDQQVRFIGNGLASGVSLPYGNGAFSMLVLLPHAGHTVEQLVDSLTSDAWRTLATDGLGGSGGAGTVDLPKFTLAFGQSLRGPLAALGMGIAFTDQADFSRMTSVPVLISDVKQKSWIDVNEEGTEAAAATSVSIGVTSAPPGVRVDRPFVFAIRERFSGALLFIGKVARLPGG